MTHTKKEALQTELASMGFTMTTFLAVKTAVKESTRDWEVTVENKNKKFVAEYHQGLGHLPKTGKPLPPPSIVDTIWSLLMDSRSADQGFESWAGDLGYDPDSRKAYKIFEACQKERCFLLECVGPEGLEKLYQLFEDY